MYRQPVKGLKTLQKRQPAGMAGVMQGAKLGGMMGSLLKPPMKKGGRILAPMVTPKMNPKSIEAIKRRLLK